MNNCVTYQGMEFVPFISRDKISARITELSKDIARDYCDKTPLFICVLKGAFHFASDLFRQYPGDAEIDFIRLKSYEGTGSTGVVNEVLGLDTSIEGRDIIIVEDIIDTGLTMRKLLADLGAMKPKSIRIATMLFKPEALEEPISPEYIGFSIPCKFILGFGLDIDNLARNLNDIYVLKQD